MIYYKKYKVKDLRTLGFYLVNVNKSKVLVDFVHIY